MHDALTQLAAIDERGRNALQKQLARIMAQRLRRSQHDPQFGAARATKISMMWHRTILRLNTFLKYIR
jgi:hypothetical protein